MRQRYPFAGAEDISLPETAMAAGFEVLDSEFEDAQIELIGDAYIHLLCERTRGEFYTPPHVVRHCLDVAWDGLPERVWDPACGTGNFLLGVIRRARKELDGERLLEWVCNAVYGTDIDPRAIEIARCALFVELSYELRNREEWLDRLRISIDTHLNIGDSLLTDFTTIKPYLIITNPPYVSFGSRNQPAMPDSHSRIMRAMYPAASEYKIRMHSLFQEMALKQLASGGVACLLVPDAFLTGAFYKKLRRFIHEHAEIEALVELPESTFPDAVAGKWCIAKYRTGAGQEGKVLLEQHDKDGLVSAIHVPQNELVDVEDKHRFLVVFNEEDAELLHRCRGMARLADLAHGHTGIRARAGQQTIIADTAAGPLYRRGLISGASVNQHSVSWDGKWLNIDPALLFGGGFDAGVIENPKILMRQTADRIVAAVDEDGLYHLNNVHSFSLVSSNEGPETLYFLCGLMNSALWRRLYQLRSREGKRALAQIDIEMIESMPMPAPDKDTMRRIAGLARRREQAAIDVIVDELYGTPVRAKVN